MVWCRRNGTSIRSQCTNHRRPHGRFFQPRLCSADRRAKKTKQEIIHRPHLVCDFEFINILELETFKDLPHQLTLTSFEFLRSVANGRSGSLSSLLTSSCGAACFSNAFANPLNFFSSACSCGSDSIFSIFSQNPRLAALAFTTLQRSDKFWTFLAQIRNILNCFKCGFRSFIEFVNL